MEPLGTPRNPVEPLGTPRNPIELKSEHNEQTKRVKAPYYYYYYYYYLLLLLLEILRSPRALGDLKIPFLINILFDKNILKANLQHHSYLFELTL